MLAAGWPTKGMTGRRSGCMHWCAIHHASERFLKKRRRTTNPAVPIPRRANEAGSGTAEALNVPLFCAVKLAIEPSVMCRPGLMFENASPKFGSTKPEANVELNATLLGGCELASDPEPPTPNKMPGLNVAVK